MRIDEAIAVPAYYIGLSAKMIGINPKTLRRWEASGRLIPDRTNGGWRYYTLDQVNEARRWRGKHFLSRVEADKIWRKEVKKK